jgi:hypothetical protein
VTNAEASTPRLWLLPESLPASKLPTDAAAIHVSAGERAKQIEALCRQEFESILSDVGQMAQRPCAVMDAEPALWRRCLALGRLLMVLWLARTEERLMKRVPERLLRGNRFYERRGKQRRELGTLFGKVSYWRSYVYCPETGRGYYPVDDAVGLSADGFTLPVVSLATRLTTRMSYAAAASVLSWFLLWAPATRTLQELTLGVGQHGHRFQEQAPPPVDDGEVLVIQIDSKGIPTATEHELEARRGPRTPRQKELSRRHRGRCARQRRSPGLRRDPDDHSKNARMATVVIMYTLRQDGTTSEPRLVGPLNVRVHASFAPKRYAFQVARREAEKRGFGPKSGRRIQFVNDGDEDLETYRRQYFGDYSPDQVVLTADLMHVLEYLWDAAAVLHPDDRAQRAGWVAIQKRRLLASDSESIRNVLRAALEQLPRKGPGNKAKRETLVTTLRYLTNNAARLDYRLVRSLDLELASGMVEGAVKNLLGLRFDQGGMRWIPERAEALLQLRCIELNGQWDDFIRWLDDQRAHQDPSRPTRFRSRKPTPLPAVLPTHLAIAHAEHHADKMVES